MRESLTPRVSPWPVEQAEWGAANMSSKLRARGLLQTSPGPAWPNPESPSAQQGTPWQEPTQPTVATSPESYRSPELQNHVEGLPRGPLAGVSPGSAPGDAKHKGVGRTVFGRASGWLGPPASACLPTPCDVGRHRGRRGGKRACSVARLLRSLRSSAVWLWARR